MNVLSSVFCANNRHTVADTIHDGVTDALSLFEMCLLLLLATITADSARIDKMIRFFFFCFSFRFHVIRGMEMLMRWDWEGVGGAGVVSVKVCMGPAEKALHIL